MADEQDESQKTEEPTAKRLADAHEKGDVAKSQEITTWFMIAMATLVLYAFGGDMARSLGGLLERFFERPDEMRLDGGSALALARDLALALAGLLALPVALLSFAALAGHLVQHRPIFTTSKLEPKLDKLSPLEGFKRLFGPTALANFAKGIAKLALVGTAAFLVIWPERAVLGSLVTSDPTALLPLALSLSLKLLVVSLVVLAVIAALDYAHQRQEFMKRNRMTKQEVRDEFRQQEGDPHVKAKIRQIRVERSRRRMMAKVPEATVVVTNPTHYAVALQYESGKMAAPVCLAKGIDAVALRIRVVAEENNVPVVEDPPLARTLYATVEIDEEIKPEHYKAVAGVIGYVLRLKRGGMAPARRSPRLPPGGERPGEERGDG